MYEKIKIENFRGINNLELNNLRQFNLFVGKNNCGKTSLLESIFIISNPAKPFSFVLVSNVRDHFITQPYSWTVFFNKMDIEFPIRLTGEILKSKETRMLTIKALPGKSVAQPTYETIDLSQKGSRGEPLDKIIGLSIEFSISKSRGKKQTYESKIWSGKEKLESDTPGNYTETLKSTFPNPMTRRGDMITWFSEILIRKQEEKILKILKIIEPRLISLSIIGTENILYCDMGFTKLLPLSTAGEGLNRLLYIILAIFRTSGGVVLIDEIENGLHYSTQEILWKAVFEAAIAFDVQVFAATHSYENVKAFNEAYEKLNDKGDKIRLFRIETKKDEVRLIDFNHEMINTAIERNWEVR